MLLHGMTPAESVSLLPLRSACMRGGQRQTLHHGKIERYWRWQQWLEVAYTVTASTFVSCTTTESLCELGCVIESYYVCVCVCHTHIHTHTYTVHTYIDRLINLWIDGWIKNTEYLLLSCIFYPVMNEKCNFSKADKDRERKKDIFETPSDSHSAGWNFFHTDQCYGLINTSKPLFKFRSCNSCCQSLLTKITFQRTKEQTISDKCNCKNHHCLFQCLFSQWKYGSKTIELICWIAMQCNVSILEQINKQKTVNFVEGMKKNSWHSSQQGQYNLE